MIIKIKKKRETFPAFKIILFYFSPAGPVKFCPSILAPQDPQNFVPGFTFAPHEVQNVIVFCVVKPILEGL